MLYLVSHRYIHGLYKTFKEIPQTLRTLNHRRGFYPDAWSSKMIQMDGLLTKVANTSLQICEEEKKSIEIRKYEVFVDVK